MRAEDTLKRGYAGDYEAYPAQARRNPAQARRNVAQARRNAAQAVANPLFYQTTHPATRPIGDSRWPPMAFDEASGQTPGPRGESCRPAGRLEKGQWHERRTGTEGLFGNKRMGGGPRFS